MPDRTWLGIQSGIRAVLQAADHAANSVWIVFDPRAQPTANVSAARDRGEIMKLLQQAAAREALENSQSKGRAADTAT
jgi:hypothetical protein